MAESRRRWTARFARWHIWLGWLVGVPLILWTATGLFMVSQPIEIVRGEHLKSPSANIAPFEPVAPALEGRPATQIALVQQARGPAWVIDYADGGKRRADARSGQLSPPVAAEEAAEIARSYYADEARFTGIQRFSADDAPIDLRRVRPSWRAHFGDGTHIYIDADTGQVLALRTRFWRWFDVMWGLHIMDLQTREDSSHPILIGTAALSLLSLLIGFTLLFRRRQKSR